MNSAASNSDLLLPVPGSTDAQVGGVAVPRPVELPVPLNDTADRSEVRVLDRSVEPEIVRRIDEAKKAGDTLGGEVEVVARGVAVASADLAHSVHVEVLGLRPARDYFYQFDVRDEESPIGHFRTTPSTVALAANLDFAFVTCQNWEDGFFTAYRDMLRHDLDLVLHLGDYTYEYPIGGGSRRGIPVPD